MHPPRHCSQRIVIEARHLPGIDPPIRQHTIPPLPNRRCTHGDRVQPARILPLHQHPIEQIRLSDLRESVPDEPRPGKPGGDLEAAVGTHDMREAGSGSCFLGRSGEERKADRECEGGLRVGG